MSRIKVCMCSSVHPADDIRIFYKEAVSLVEAGFDVSFVVRHDREETLNGVRIVPLKKEKNRFERIFVKTWRTMSKALAEKADIYHFHDPELIPQALLLKLFGKKVIFDVHEDVPKQILSKKWIARPLRKAISWLYTQLERFAVGRFDAVITATAHIEERLKPSSRKTQTVHNYPLLQEFDLLSWDQQKDQAVCFIGGISRGRGIFEMVEAILMADVTLYLVGPVHYEQDRQEVMRMPGWSKVANYGYVNRDEVRRVLASSKAGLVTEHPLINYVDALPIKMFEYMASGIPVISSDFPVWKEIVEGNNCGICVDPLDAGAIAKAIRWVMDHEAEAREMGMNGQKAIAEKYNWSTQAELLLGLYGELTGAGRAMQHQAKEVGLLE